MTPSVGRSTKTTHSLPQFEQQQVQRSSRWRPVRVPFQTPDGGEGQVGQRVATGRGRGPSPMMLRMRSRCTRVQAGVTEPPAATTA